MKWDTVKHSEQIKLSGVDVHLDEVNGAIVGVTVSQPDGAQLRVCKHDYSISVLVPAAPTMVERYRVKGKIHEVPVDEIIDGEYEAKRRAQELTAAGGDVSLTRTHIPDGDFVPPSPTPADEVVPF